MHDKTGQVAAALARVGVKANLTQASGSAMPWPDAHFNAVVAISVMEFVDDVERTAAEVARVLTPGGVFVVVNPGASSLLDFGLNLLTGESADKDFGDRRAWESEVLRRHFDVLDYRIFPWPRIPGLCMYHAFKLGRKA